MLNKSLHLALLSPVIQQAESIQRVQDYLSYPKYLSHNSPLPEDEHRKHEQMLSEYQSYESDHEGKCSVNYGNFNSEKGKNLTEWSIFFKY